MEEAFEWFKSALPPETSSEATEFYLSRPEVARNIFLKKCPFLFLFSSSSDESKYWSDIYRKLKNFIPTDDIPNPSLKFLNFISYIYQRKELYNPNSVFSCIAAMNTLHYTNLNNFVIYTCPLLFRSPSLYVETLHELCVEQSPLWRKISSDQSIIDSFVSLYLNLLSPPKNKSNQKSWRFRVITTSFLYDLIFLGAKRPLHPLQLAVKLADILIEFLRFSNKESTPEFFMIIRRIFNTLGTLHQKDITQGRIFSIIKNLDQNKSDFFYIAIKFLFSLPSTIPSIQPSKAKALNYIIDNRQINDLRDFRLLLSLTDDNNYMKTIIYLSKTASHSKPWHRCCIQTMKTLIIKYQAKSDLREWLLLFTKRLFQFIVLSNIKKKYIGKSVFYCETLGIFYGLRLTWLHIILNTYIASAMATKQTPPFFKLFFTCKGSVDDNFVAEVEAFSNDANLSLKVFPYEKNHSGIISAPITELATKKATGRSSSSRVSSLQDKLAPLHQQNSQPQSSQSKKKVEKLIRKPVNVSTQKSHIRPLASTLYNIPINRR